MTILFFIIGLLVGGFLGVTLMCILSVASESDKKTEKLERTINTNEQNNKE